MVKQVQSQAGTGHESDWQESRMIDMFLSVMQQGLPQKELQFEVISRLIHAMDRPIEQFIDIACGDGIVGQWVLDLHPKSHGLFIDYSEPMLVEAQKRLAPYEDRTRVGYVDLRESEWVDGYHLLPQSQDLVISRYAIHHLTDENKQSLYQQIYELLAPSGMFINVEHVSSSTDWLNCISDDAFMDSIYEHAQKVDPACTRQQIVDRFSERMGEVHDRDICATAEAQCDWLRKIGYADVDCYMKYFEFAVFGGRRPVS